MFAATKQAGKVTKLLQMVTVSISSFTVLFEELLHPIGGNPRPQQRYQPYLSSKHWYTSGGTGATVLLLILWQRLKGRVHSWIRIGFWNISMCEIGWLLSICKGALPRWFSKKPLHDSSFANNEVAGDRFCPPSRVQEISQGIMYESSEDHQ